MNDVIRHVRDIEAGDRRALEHLLGARLEDDAHVFIVAYTPGPSESATRDAARANLARTLAEQADRAKAAQVTADDADAAVDEAMGRFRGRS